MKILLEIKTYCTEECELSRWNQIKVDLERTRLDSMIAPLQFEDIRVKFHLLRKRGMYLDKQAQCNLLMSMLGGRNTMRDIMMHRLDSTTPSSYFILMDKRRELYESLMDVDPTNELFKKEVAPNKDATAVSAAASVSARGRNDSQPVKYTNNSQQSTTVTHGTSHVTCSRGNRRRFKNKCGVGITCSGCNQPGHLAGAPICTAKNVNKANRALLHDDTVVAYSIQIRQTKESGRAILSDDGVNFFLIGRDMHDMIEQEYELKSPIRAETLGGSRLFQVACQVSMSIENTDGRFINFRAWGLKGDDMESNFPGRKKHTAVIDPNDAFVVMGGVKLKLISTQCGRWGIQVHNPTMSNDYVDLSESGDLVQSHQSAFPGSTHIAVNNSGNEFGYYEETADAADPETATATAERWLMRRTWRPRTQRQ